MELHNLINWVEKDALNRLEIWNQETGKVIDKVLSAADAKLRSGSVRGYFNELAQNGVNIVQVLQRRKNGSSFTKESCAYNFIISTEAQNNVAASGRSVYPAATPQQPMQSPGLNFPGLGYPELYQEQKSTNDQLLQKIATLETEKAIIREEKLKLEYDVKRLEDDSKKEEKPSVVDSLLENFAKNPAAFGQFISAMKGSSAAPGLNAPQPQQRPQLSDIKEMVIDIIANNKQLTDNHVSAAQYVLIEGLKDNEEFFMDFMELLKKHNLIPTEN